jgi:hypothetical protein
MLLLRLLQLLLLVMVQTYMELVMVLRLGGVPCQMDLPNFVHAVHT